MTDEPTDWASTHSPNRKGWEVEISIETSFWKLLLPSGKKGWSNITNCSLILSTTILSHVIFPIFPQTRVTTWAKQHSEHYVQGSNLYETMIASLQISLVVFILLIIIVEIRKYIKLHTQQTGSQIEPLCMQCLVCVFKIIVNIQNIIKQKKTKMCIHFLFL